MGRGKVLEVTHELSEFQQKVYSLFEPNVDRPIHWLYDKTYNSNGASSTVRVRDMQQRLGPVFARINDKLVGQRIEPGQLKRTYRLSITTPTV